MATGRTHPRNLPARTDRPRPALPPKEARAHATRYLFAGCHFNVAIVDLRFLALFYVRTPDDCRLGLSGHVHSKVDFTAGPSRGPKIVVVSRLGTGNSPNVIDASRATRLCDCSVEISHGCQQSFFSIG